MEEKYWSKFAQVYDANQEKVVGSELLEAMKSKLGELSQLGEVAEFGCGTGYFTMEIAKLADRVVATDLSDEQLKVAIERLREFPQVTVQQEDCTKSSFESNRFDTVFIANVLHVIEKPAAAVQESHRIIKEGGKLVIFSFTNQGMSFWETIKLASRFLRTWGKPPRYSHSLSPDMLRTLFEEAGFSVEEACLVGDKTKAVYGIAQKK